MADKPAYDSGFFATVKSQRGEGPPVLNHVRALLVEPSSANAARLAALLKEANVGAVVAVADAGEASAALAGSEPRGVDVAVVDLRKGGAGRAAAEALRAKVALPMLLLVDGLGMDVLDLAFKLKPATIVPPPLNWQALNAYVAQIARRPG